MLFYQTYEEINQIFIDATMPFVRGFDEWKNTLKYPESVALSQIDYNVLMPYFVVVAFYSNTVPTECGSLGGIYLNGNRGRWIYRGCNQTKEELKDTRGQPFTHFGRIDTRIIQQACNYALNEVKSNYNPQYAEAKHRDFKRSSNVFSL